jgi:hypothetical protein
MKAGYIYCKPLSDLADQATPPAGRSSRVHALIQSLGLVGNEPSYASAQCCRNTASTIIPNKAHREDLQRFHSAAFVGEWVLILVAYRSTLTSSISPSQLTAALTAASGGSSIRDSDADSSSGTDEDDSDDNGSSSSRASSSFDRPRKRQRRRSSDRYGLTVGTEMYIALVLGLRADLVCSLSRLTLLHQTTFLGSQDLAYRQLVTSVFPLSPATQVLRFCRRLKRAAKRLRTMSCSTGKAGDTMP